jgi:diphosphomevalonate decarboxylase
MQYAEKYKNEAISDIPAKGLSGSVAWSSPSNIALVKYWGKKDPQLPMNPSVSITLDQARTITKVDFSISRIRKGTILRYNFDGKRNTAFESRVENYLRSIIDYLPFLQFIDLVVESKNTFPHSAGIASSASAFSAIALALTEIEYKLKESLHFDNNFYRKASFLARLGSGSACRSVYGGLALWGKTEFGENSSDEIAIPLDKDIHPVFRNYQDVILVLDIQQKAVSSTKGHEFMNTNPFATERFVQAEKHTQSLLKILKSGDLHGFAQLVEYEALCLHAMMMSSFPGYILMKPATLEVIHQIREFRADTGVPLAFSLDAGANVHLLFPADSTQVVSDLVNNKLAGFCHEGMYIADSMGEGPIKI